MSVINVFAIIFRPYFINLFFMSIYRLFCAYIVNNLQTVSLNNEVAIVIILLNLFIVLLHRVCDANYIYCMLISLSFDHAIFSELPFEVPILMIPYFTIITQRTILSNISYSK